MEASRKVLSRSLVGQKITFFPQCFQYTQNPPTYLVETVCEMDICQVGGKTLGIADKVFTSLVTCQGERVCCLLVLNLVSSTLSCISQPRLRLRVLDICGFV
jgi:hypothetical protein